MSRQLARRIAQVAIEGKRQWTTPPRPDLRFDLLTAVEYERAADLRERLEAVTLERITNTELDDLICLHQRLSGEREAPCWEDGAIDA